MKVIDAAPARGWRMLGMGREFTPGDKVIYIASYTWIGIWTVIFVAGTIYNLTHDVADTAWMEYWKIQTIIYGVISAVVLVWFSVGGVKDMREMFRALGSAHRDDSDDGFIVD